MHECIYGRGRGTSTVLRTCIGRVKPDDKPEWTGTYGVLLLRHVMHSRHVAGPEWAGACVRPLASCRSFEATRS